MNATRVLFCWFGRAPHGARGLKFWNSAEGALAGESRPAWGAWIEIVTKAVTLDRIVGRAPHGARGLKCTGNIPAVEKAGRAPHGARGLKYKLELYHV